MTARTASRRSCHRALVGTRNGIAAALTLRFPAPRGEEAEFGGHRTVAADAVRGPVPGGGHQPRAGVGRDAVARPTHGRNGERLLRGLLREHKTAEEADQTGDDAAPFLMEDPVEGYFCQYASDGRISIAPPRRAAGTRAATSIAASRSSASSTKNPPTASFMPTNGPSVVRVFPPSTRTVVASSGNPRGGPGLTPGVWLSAP